MAEELMKQRATYKARMMKSAMTLNRLIKEREVNLIKKHGMKMKTWFCDFDETNDAYVETLTDEAEIAAASSYYDAVYDSYMDQLDALNSAMDSLTVQAPVVVENIVPESTLSAISQIVNLPRMDLEPFDGTVSKYQRFMVIFKQLIEPSTTDPTLRLTRLLTHTTGDANTAISSIDPSDPNCYERALALLKEQFGSKYLIATNIMRTLSNGPMATTPRQIRTLAYELRNAQITLTNEDMYAEINTQTCIVSVCKRMSNELRDKWTSLTTTNRRKHGDYLPFSKFVDFVEDEAWRLNDPVFGREAFDYEPSRHQRPKSFAASSRNVSPTAANMPVTSPAAANDMSPCVVCSDMHKLFYCNTFRAMSLDERRKLVSDKQLCSLCLYPNHTADSCSKPYRCNINNCKMRHCRYLHIDSQPVHASYATANIDVDSTMPSNVLMPIVPVIVNDCFHTYALLDTGSTHTFCSRRLTHALDLDGCETTYNLMTLSNDEEKNSIKVDLSLQPKDRSSCFSLRNVLVTERIPLSTDEVDISRYEHLKAFSYPGETSVDVLIGQDYADLLRVHEYRDGGEGQPYAARTSLGWSLHGSAASRTQSTDVVSHLILTGNTKEEVELLTTSTQLDDDVLIDELAHINTHNHTCRPAPNSDQPPPDLNLNIKAIPQISMSTITKNTSTCSHTMIVPLQDHLELEEKQTHSQVLGMNQNDVVHVTSDPKLAACSLIFFCQLLRSLLRWGSVVATYLFPQCPLNCLSCCLTYCPIEGASRIYCRLQTLCLIIAQKAFTQTLILFIVYMNLKYLETCSIYMFMKC